MPFCIKCGTQLIVDAKFCQSCGQRTEAADPESRCYQDSMASPTTSQENPDDASQNTAMAVLAYIIFFIPLLTGDFKASPFVKFHTNQGTVMFIVALAYGVVCGILSTILIFIPFIGWLMILLLGMVWLIYPVFMVMGIINVTNGQMKPLPLIGDITIIK